MYQKYQLVWLGDRPAAKMMALWQGIEEGVEALGLEASAVLRVLDPPAGFDLEPEFPMVGIWWGEESPDHEQLVVLKEMQALGAPVLPVVSDLDCFGEEVPEKLRPINGLEWKEDPSTLTSTVLRLFGLTRAQRSAFISYRRKDSRAVAVQLLHLLNDHGYRAFLDTASVDFALPFQDELWDAMADVDMLLFLDTPDALTSNWVEKELNKAHNKGLGVLQLVWPGWNPTDGTEMCHHFLLKESDFESGAPPTENGQANPLAELTSEALTTVFDTVEKVRIRCLGSRRSRLNGELERMAVKHKLSVVTEPSGYVRVLGRSGDRLGSALPVMGLPTAETLFSVHDQSPQEPVEVIYDGDGIRGERRRFLSWLNRRVPRYRTRDIRDVQKWMIKL